MVDKILHTGTDQVRFHISKVRDTLDVTEAVNEREDLCGGEIPLVRVKVLSVNAEQRHLVVKDMGRV